MSVQSGEHYPPAIPALLHAFHVLKMISVNDKAEFFL